MAFWGDRVQPAIEMVERGDIDYLCCDHLAELTMSILAKQRASNSDRGYTRDILDLLRGALPTIVEKGIKVVTNSGGANPRAAAEAIASLAKELGVSGLRIAVVTGDDIEADIDDLMAQGVSFDNMDTGQPLASVRDKLTHAAVYTGCEGIVEALQPGRADRGLRPGHRHRPLPRPAHPRVRLGARRLAAARHGHRHRARHRVRRPGHRRSVRRRLAGHARARGARLPDRRGLRRRHRRADQDPGHRRPRRHRHRERAAGLRDPRPGQLPHRRRDRRLHAR